LQEVQDIIAAEFILETELFTTFGITEVDLASYINDRQHSLQSVDAVINMLCNATNTIAVLIGQLYQFIDDPSDAAVVLSEPVANITGFRQIKPSSGQPTNTIYLLKTGTHYDAIIISPYAVYNN